MSGALSGGCPVSIGLVGQRQSGPHRITGRASCTFVFEGNALRVEWEPRVPRSLSPRALERYRRARDAFVASLMTEAGGGNAVVVEPGRDRMAARVVSAPTSPEGRQ